MPRQKSNRKRRAPERFEDADVVAAARAPDESNVAQQNAEQSVANSPSIEVVPSVGANLNDSPAEVEGGATTNPNVRMRVKVRKDNSGMAYRLLRRSICTLTAKINELTKEVELSKQTTNSVAADLTHENQVEAMGDNQTSMEVMNTADPASQPVENPAANQIPSELPGSAGQSKIDPKQNTGGDIDYKQIIYNIRNINLERPKFETIEGSIHPVTFLEELETYLKKALKEGQGEVELILECLKGVARDWARVYSKRWSNLNDFKRDFLATFWGEKEQNELRRKIVHGTWDRQNSPSMLNYFLGITGKAQMLSHQIPENQMVSDVIRHFPRHVQQVWFTLQKENIIEAAEFLRGMDEINKQEQHVYTSGGTKASTRNFEKRRNEIKQNFRNWQKPVAASKTKEVNAVVSKEAGGSNVEEPVEVLN
ncbi:hypothetical protein O0L34_g19335 [Tuta absoluta]|nr:hypothetical protein O0L34_g19335 [Tuta absoluta]